MTSPLLALIMGVFDCQKGFSRVIEQFFSFEEFFILEFLYYQPKLLIFIFECHLLTFRGWFTSIVWLSIA